MATNVASSRRLPRGAEMLGDCILLPRSHYARFHSYARHERYVVDAIEYSRWSMGRKLRRLRLEAGLTRVQVAARAKVSRKAVANVEQGQGHAAEGTVRRIVKVIEQAKRHPSRARVRTR